MYFAKESRTDILKKLAEIQYLTGEQRCKLGDMLEEIEFSAIQDENARKLVKILLNQIEQFSANLRDAYAVIQQRGEINRLKGEQGKPEVKANIVKIAAKYSSEKERGKLRVRDKKSKKASLSR